MTTILWFIIAVIIVIVFFGMINNTISMRSVEYDSTHSSEKSIPLTNNVNSVEDKLPDEIKPSEPLMTEGEFAELKKSIMQLSTMINELSSNQRLSDMINGKSVEAGGDRMPDQAYFGQLLKTIFITDLKHSYEKMGKLFKISTYTAEGQCLLIIIDFLKEEASELCEYTKFMNALNPIDKAFMHSAIKYLSQLMTESITISVEGDEEFAFSAMLINFDANSEYLSNYRSMLRYIITSISGICREAQIKEDEWIKNI